MADARFASVLRLLLNEYDIYDADTLAACIGGVAGDALAAWLRSDMVRAKVASLTASADPLPPPTAQPPTPPTVTVVLQVAVPRVPTIESGTSTDKRCTHNAQAQTARGLFYGIDVGTQTEPVPIVVEACNAEREAAEQRALDEEKLRQAAEQQAAAATTAWWDAERARGAAEKARVAAEGALADALAAHEDLTGRVEMVAASTNTIYLVEGVGLACKGTQTMLHVLPPDCHSPAPQPPLPRSSSPPPHHLPPRPPSPPTPSFPQSREEPPPVFADCPHYHAAPMTSRGRGRRRARVSEW